MTGSQYIEKYLCTAHLHSVQMCALQDPIFLKAKIPCFFTLYNTSFFIWSKWAKTIFSLKSDLKTAIQGETIPKRLTLEQAGKCANLAGTAQKFGASRITMPEGGTDYLQMIFTIVIVVQRLFSFPPPLGNFLGPGKSLGRCGYTSHSPIITREVLILTLTILIALQGCIS